VRQLGLALYGLAAVVGGYVFLMLGLIAWRHRLGPLVRDHVPSPWDAVLLVAAIALVTLPVWLRAAKRIARFARARAGRRAAPVPAELPAEAAA
jgi:hypothetical protein